MARHNPITNPIEYHIDNPYILKEIQNRNSFKSVSMYSNPRYWLICKLLTSYINPCSIIKTKTVKLFICINKLINKMHKKIWKISKNHLKVLIVLLKLIDLSFFFLYTKLRSSFSRGCFFGSKSSVKLVRRKLLSWTSYTLKISSSFLF